MISIPGRLLYVPGRANVAAPVTKIGVCRYMYLYRATFNQAGICTVWQMKECGGNVRKTKLHRGEYRTVLCFHSLNLCNVCAYRNVETREVQKKSLARNVIKWDIHTMHIHSHRELNATTYSKQLPDKTFYFCEPLLLFPVTILAHHQRILDIKGKNTHKHTHTHKPYINSPLKKNASVRVIPQLCSIIRGCRSPRTCKQKLSLRSLFVDVFFFFFSERHGPSIAWTRPTWFLTNWRSSVPPYYRFQCTAIIPRQGLEIRARTHPY